MTIVEILTILFSICIVLSVFFTWIYKRLKHMPSDECACCNKRIKRNLNKIRKEIAREKMYN